MKSTIELLKQSLNSLNEACFGSKEVGEWPIKFQGREFLLIGSRRCGSITTREQFDAFEDSYAYLQQDGRIMRHREQIGRIEEIEFL